MWKFSIKYFWNCVLIAVDLFNCQIAWPQGWTIHKNVFNYFWRNCCETKIHLQTHMWVKIYIVLIRGGIVVKQKSICTHMWVKIYKNPSAHTYVGENIYCSHQGENYSWLGENCVTAHKWGVGEPEHLNVKQVRPKFQ